MTEVKLTKRELMLLAADVGCDRRTVERWAAGLNVMDAHQRLLNDAARTRNIAIPERSEPPAAPPARTKKKRPSSPRQKAAR